ncbi:MAG: sigma-54 dependent transcriptional regulator [Nitrospirae bacterium]|nr:sigma-54 dependent transcriptional regulator [Nitrospirota bacterium]MCL5977906.1 sigma-54 dependent transcriptional regulator [Nitrospirota bacterium]
MKSVLIVDDEADMALAIQESLKRFGFKPTVYNNPVDALNELNLSDFSLVITDMKMPGMNGIEFLHEIRKKGIFVPVIVITGYGTVENAVDAMKLGATDYIMKPFSFESLKRVIDRILPSEESDVVAESQVMKNLMAVIREVAKSDITVLLSGESGTGKEVIAKVIHKNSLRADKPFVAINCAAISENLLEAELFGHEKGAFTGAIDKRIGKFELADKGTLLLDEVSEMAFPLQAKFLRAIQEREVDRVGGRSPIPVDVRIIATTNKDLLSEVKKGRFREDLYYRLNVFPIKLPPLRERREDIIPLAEFFIRKLSQKMGKTFKMSGDFESYLLKNAWEGNVRELENLIYRTIVLSAETLLPPVEGVGVQGQEAGGQNEAAGRMKDMERDLIVNTLRETGGNRTRTAQLLGVSVRTIRNKIKEYDISGEETKR